MMDLLCVIPGDAQGVFCVEVQEDDSVSGLKSVICKENAYEFPTFELKLFLARKENGSWLS
ncbi:hypothetical protein PHYSODRAFT_380705, partial [Phytophthora sojae]